MQDVDHDRCNYTRWVKNFSKQEARLGKHELYPDVFLSP